MKAHLFQLQSSGYQKLNQKQTLNLTIFELTYVLSTVIKYSIYVSPSFNIKADSTVIAQRNQYTNASWLKPL